LSGDGEGGIQPSAASMVVVWVVVIQWGAGSRSNARAKECRTGRNLGISLRVTGSPNGSLSLFSVYSVYTQVVRDMLGVGEVCLVGGGSREEEEDVAGLGWSSNQKTNKNKYVDLPNFLDGHVIMFGSVAKLVKAPV
jgi:hypothetical protein